jgi:hypothetical protein
MTVGDSQHMLGLQSEALPPLPDPTEAIFFADCRIDRDGLVLAAGPLCPECLAERGYAMADWELTPVTVCSQHRKLLRDSCERCGASLSWSRPAFRVCGECGADLSCQDTPEVADEAVIALNEDFQALAPFRVTSGTGPTRSVQWDEMFRIFKALLLPDADWALGRWPRLFASAAPIQHRHRALIELARCRVGHAYDLSRLRWKSDHALGALAAIPPVFTKEEVARRFLEADAGLSRESADAISGADAIPPEPAAYEAIRPWPPALRNCDDVAGFLGVPKATVDALLRTGRLTPPDADDDGFDADAVLGAGRFLQELVDLTKLTELAGIEAPPTALTAYGLLPRWNGIELRDHRVDAERVLEIQRLLMARWHGTPAPLEPIPLRRLVQGSDRPFEALAAYVQRIAGGEVDRIGWGPPFRWADIEIEAGASHGP